MGCSPVQLYTTAETNTISVQHIPLLPRNHRPSVASCTYLNGPISPFLFPLELIEVLEPRPVLYGVSAQCSGNGPGNIRRVLRASLVVVRGGYRGLIDTTMNLKSMRAGRSRVRSLPGGAPDWKLINPIQFFENNSRVLIGESYCFKAFTGRRFDIHDTTIQRFPSIPTTDLQPCT
jgi:hypothetical protein